jgi:exonuclease VII large subunit
MLSSTSIEKKSEDTVAKVNQNINQAAMKMIRYFEENNRQQQEYQNIIKSLSLETIGNQKELEKELQKIAQLNSMSQNIETNNNEILQSNQFIKESLSKEAKVPQERYESNFDGLKTLHEETQKEIMLSMHIK